MNRLQKTRHELAQHGIECTIDETKDLIHIASQLRELAKIPDDEFKNMIDFGDFRQESLYNAVLKVKYGQTA